MSKEDKELLEKIEKNLQKLLDLTIVGPVGLSLDRDSAHRLLNMTKKLNGKSGS